MDTVVSLTVVTGRSEEEINEKFSTAFGAFRSVEMTCSRFDRHSELMRLVQQVGKPIKVSDLLYEAIKFSLEVAKLTDGIFDPTVGKQMEMNGFQQHYLTKEIVNSPLMTNLPVSYLDIELDEEKRTVCLWKPLVIDLGAVAKGLAVDLAAKELNSLEGFVIDAGGDLYVSGTTEQMKPWRIGIQHPLRKTDTICSISLSDMAICTSGSYERISPKQSQTHHLIHPQSGNAVTSLVSCSVTAPFAIMADAFSTAAFLLGPDKGIVLLKQVGLDGILVTPSLDIYTTDKLKGGVFYDYSR